MRFPSYKRPMQEVNGQLYIIHAEYSYDKIKDVSAVKSWLGVDHVFKSHRDNTYIFCELIEEIKWENIT